MEFDMHTIACRSIIVFGQFPPDPSRNDFPVIPHQIHKEDNNSSQLANISLLL